MSACPMESAHAEAFAEVVVLVSLTRLGEMLEKAGAHDAALPKIEAAPQTARAEVLGLPTAAPLM